MVVARATALTDAWDAVRTVLTSSSGIGTTNIFSSSNSQLAKDKGYPIVIIGPPSVSFDKVVLNGAITSSKIVVNLEVYHTSAQTLKSLVDTINSKLLTNRATFSGYGMKNMSMEGGSYDFWEDGDKKIHRMEYAISFDFVVAGVYHA
jgi:hypothetical protein